MRDLNRFASALLGGKLLTEAMARTLVSPKVELGHDAYGYGFGIRRGKPGEPPTFGHNGGSPGVSSELDMNPALGLRLVMLGNRDAPTFVPALDLVLNTLHMP